MNLFPVSGHNAEKTETQNKAPEHGAAHGAAPDPGPLRAQQRAPRSGGDILSKLGNKSGNYEQKIAGKSSIFYTELCCTDLWSFKFF